MEMVFSAEGFSENDYNLKNASLSNVSSDINLYLLSEGSSTKFYVTANLGVSPLADAMVIVEKNFIGEGLWKTVAVKKTDADGKFVDYLDIDNQYKFTVVKDGTAYSPIEKQSSCAASPCTITLQISAGVGSIFEGYDETFASNTVSLLTYNTNTQIVTYNFIDSTALAHYFRLVVKSISMNTTEGATICDSSLYTTSGTMTCNMTGYDGEFIAKGFISRSPEKLDKLIDFVISSVKSGLGVMAILFCMGIIITLVFAAAAISGGNPAVIIFVFGISILMLKLSTIFPFSWVVTALIEILCIYIYSQVKT
jgi:hypothetical protein